LLIGLLVAFVLTVLFWFFLYQPQNERQREIEQEIADLEVQQATLENRRQALEEVRQNEVQIRAALARTEQFIPSGVSQPAALRQLQRTANAAGAEIVQLTFGDAIRSDAGGETGDPNRVLAEIPVTIAVDGGYFQIVDFLRRLEVDVPRATLVEDVSILESPEAMFPTLRATLTSTMFAVLNADQLPDATAGAAAPSGDQTGAPAATPTPTPGASPSPAPGGTS
jgi:Tfp pilus assembly protein PilO